MAVTTKERPNERLQAITAVVLQLDNLADQRKAIVDRLWVMEDHGKKLRSQLLKLLHDA